MGKPSKADLRNLSQYENNINSQAGEDGVIARVVELINPRKLCWEFGGADGIWFSNTRALLDNGWKGVQMDYNATNDVVKAFITVENINKLFTEHFNEVPGLLSIDIDGNDYWIWKALMCKPTIVITEMNRNVSGCKTIKYNPEHKFGNNDYYGATFEALCKLGKEKGYIPVWCNSLNILFVDKKYVGQHDEVSYKEGRGWPKGEGEWVLV